MLRLRFPVRIHSVPGSAPRIFQCCDKAVEPTFRRLRRLLGNPIGGSVKVLGGSA